MAIWDSEEHDTINSLFTAVSERSDSWIEYFKNSNEICLDGWYKLEDLKEIVKIMENLNNEK